LRLFGECGWPKCQEDDGEDRSLTTCTGECLPDKIRRLCDPADAREMKRLALQPK